MSDPEPPRLHPDDIKAIAKASGDYVIDRLTMIAALALAAWLLHQWLTS